MTIRQADLTTFVVNKQIWYEVTAILSRTVYYEIDLNLWPDGVDRFELDLRSSLAFIPRIAEAPYLIKIMFTLNVIIGRGVKPYSSRWFHWTAVGEGCRPEYAYSTRPWHFWFLNSEWTSRGWREVLFGSPYCRASTAFPDGLLSQGLSRQKFVERLELYLGVDELDHSKMVLFNAIFDFAEMGHDLL